MDGIWTISELAERAAAALAADGSAQVSGRVRDLPNERLIRWYTTIGLVDPPLGRRGRTALYGPRHLLQLVAVKRRQAIGRSIAEIQVELAAATDATLERIASLPSRPGPASGHNLRATAEAAREALRRPGRSEGPSARTSALNRSARQAPRAQGPVPGGPTDPPAVSPHPAHRQADPAAQAASKTGDDDGAVAPPDVRADRPPGSAAGSAGPTAAARPDSAADAADAESAGSAAPTSRPASFTTASAGSPGSEAAAPGTSTGEPPHHPAVSENPTAEEEGAGRHAEAARGTFWNTRPDVSYRPAIVADDYGIPLPPVVQGVRLASGVTLLLDVSALNGDDLAAIENAARPLLDVLHQRGLLALAESPAFPSADPSRRSQ
ncbi:helix-turn-helix domain-containing protein [Actinomadura soli]|uniref:helix-turn-helix domain-containing protein n=1 Tax=Actinomadura soli TaxID=2508997 RepID=UPI001E3E38FD|nr:MerR family transcriptional regulator [Actinomadura soli]